MGVTVEIYYQGESASGIFINEDMALEWAIVQSARLLRQFSVGRHQCMKILMHNTERQ